MTGNNSPSKSASPAVSFDRVLSEPLLQCMTSELGDVLKGCRDKDREANPPGLFDLQLRSDRPKGNLSWATLYYGLTKLLDVEERNEEFKLDAHATHREAGSFNPAWQKWMTLEELVRVTPDVARYLEAARRAVAPRHIEREGAVHAALASGNSDAFRVVNREASPSFRNQPTKDAISAELWNPIRDALHDAGRSEPWWPNNVKVGNSLDLLAVDVGGRLALIEAKHHQAQAKEITKVAAQVGSYARLYSYLLQDDQAAALQRIDKMLEQRVAIGLSGKGVLYLMQPVRIVPVVAIGPGRPSAEARNRLWQVAQVLDALDQPAHPRATGEAVTIEPLEVWYVDIDGRIDEIERAGDLGPPKR